MGEKLGYILPITQYSPPGRKIEKEPLKLFPSERPKLLFPLYRQTVYKATERKESNIYTEMMVSVEQYFRLTGKGKYISALR